MSQEAQVRPVTAVVLVLLLLIIIVATAVQLSRAAAL